MTAAKLAANRTNAQSSTGPQDTRRTRFNGMQHGLTSRQNVIPGESQQQYETFHQELLADLDPQSALENTLAERTIAAAWRLQRFQRVETAFFNDRMNAFHEEHPDSDPDSALANLFVDPSETARLRLFLRYQNSVQREFDKAMTELKKAKAERERDEVEAVMQEIAAPIGNRGFASQTTPQLFEPAPLPPETSRAAAICAKYQFVRPEQSGQPA